MTAQEIIKAALDFMGLIVSWPILILILVFMFRKRVEEAIGVLTERLKSVSIGGASAQFNDMSPSLRGAATSQLKENRSRGDDSDEADSQDPLQEVSAPDPPVDDADISEFGQRIENLRK